jgi:quinol monooxygenase YgiN
LSGADEGALTAGNPRGDRLAVTEGARMGFIQIIDNTTSRMEEIEALSAQLRADMAGETTVRKVTITQDRDRPGRFLVIAEFDSYEDAMKNSEHPATQAFAAKMAELCDGPPTFVNLDVVRVDAPAIDVRETETAATT